MRSAGFSLVEVLISIVILSIGLLGTAGLLSASLKNTTNSYYRSQATVLADDIADRMRANLPDARSQKYNADIGFPASNACPGAAGTMAAYDCIQWKQSLANTFPSGDGTIRVDNNGVATITIQWDGDGNRFTTTSRL